ncbi:hypothetical protein DFQ28_001796 [Apophysomyces sp. BC1034]|nr:hypothetical protein DFQ30_000941 [Apophysomyces sp. BC1015]KAG0167586.1 hypothetical protein DFQ29_000346 [Apophysomyces sp. BC1021]KAG0183018.1 hypothetical protein DFQ28_001796 [Apophysomyces sp. BC1034]
MNNATSSTNKRKREASDEGFKEFAEFLEEKLPGMIEAAVRRVFREQLQDLRAAVVGIVSEELANIGSSTNEGLQIVRGEMLPTRTIPSDVLDNVEGSAQHLLEGCSPAILDWLEIKDWKRRPAKRSLARSLRYVILAGNRTLPPDELQRRYLLLKRKAQDAFQHLESTCGFSSNDKPWSGVPADKRALAYNAMEEKGLEIGVPLDLCMDQWAAKYLVKIRWENSWGRRIRETSRQ